MGQPDFEYKGVGTIVQVIGPVIDVQFEDEQLPSIYNAIRVFDESTNNQKFDIYAEVEQHLGENRVRAVSMEPTEGLIRGMKAYDTGAPISVPVGEATLGRVINVIGHPVDQMGPINAKTFYPIHRPAPTVEEQDTSMSMLETGIKVVDLLEPYLKGGKIGL